jgi:DNA-binding response OmpR family regulator
MRSNTRDIALALERVDKKRTDILIIEADELSRKLSMELLRQAGFTRLAYATTNAEAIDALNSTLPRLIVVGTNASDADGLRLTKTIRHYARAETRLSKLADVPIIYLSPKSRAGEVTEARNSGIDEYVVKPFSINTLLKAVGSALTRRREFIVAENYIGPCRRRYRNEGYVGRLKRVRDARIMAQRRARANYSKALFLEVRDLIERLDQERYLSDKSLKHLQTHLATISQRCGVYDLKYIGAITHSLNTYLSYFEVMAQARIIKAHLSAMERLSQPTGDFAFEQEAYVEQLQNMVAKKIKNEKKFA